MKKFELVEVLLNKEVELKQFLLYNLFNNSDNHNVNRMIDNEHRYIVTKLYREFLEGLQFASEDIAKYVYINDPLHHFRNSLAYTTYQQLFNELKNS